MKIMQCWDDGVQNDVRLAEMLRKHKAKATFNLNPGLHKQSERGHGWKYKPHYEVFRLSLDEMKGVYKGFCIAGHTMTHPHLTKIDDAKLWTELADCKAFIKDFFGQEECGFAYPFGGYDERVKGMIRKAGYLYARTCANVDGALPLNNPMELPSHCHFMSPDFWRKYEEVKAIDGNFYFWGHSYEMMDEQPLWDEFEGKLARIEADPKAEWIDVRDLFMK